MTDRETTLQAQVDALTQELDLLSAKYQQSCQAYETLMFQLKQLIRGRFGSKSERFIDPEDPTGQLFDTEMGSGSTEESADTDANADEQSNVVHIASHQRHKRESRLSKDLPRREVVSKRSSNCSVADRHRGVVSES